MEQLTAKPNSADVKEFIKKTLALKEISDQSAMGKVRGWDSLRHLKLINALEKQFGVEIPTDMLPELTSVAEIILYLQSKGVLT
jgi:acyl carrier protein